MLGLQACTTIPNSMESFLIFHISIAKTLLPYPHIYLSPRSRHLDSELQQFLVHSSQLSRFLPQSLQPLCVTHTPNIPSLTAAFLQVSPCSNTTSAHCRWDSSIPHYSPSIPSVSALSPDIAICKPRALGSSLGPPHILALLIVPLAL